MGLNEFWAVLIYDGAFIVVELFKIVKPEILNADKIVASLDVTLFNVAKSEIFKDDIIVALFNVNYMK